MFSFSRCTVFITLFGPVLVSSFKLSLQDGNDTVTASPQSIIPIFWEQTENGEPTHDTIKLVLTDPDGNETKYSTDENGNTSGPASVQVGGPGNYTLKAFDDDPQDPFLTSMNFTVLAPAGGNSSTSAPTTPGTAASSTSSIGQSSESDSSGSLTTSNAAPPSMTLAPTTGQESSSAPQGGFTGDSTTGPFPTPTNGSSTNDSSQNGSSADGSSNTSSKLSSSSPPTGMIVGIVLGALAAIALILALFWVLHRKRKQRRPVSFHRDMMVRSPSVYPASVSASSTYPDGRQRTSSDLLARAGSAVVPAPGIGSSPPSMSPFRDISSLERGSSHRDSSIHTLDIQRSSVDSGMPRPLVESASTSPTAFRSPLHTPSDQDSREYWIKNSR